MSPNKTSRKVKLELHETNLKATITLLTVVRQCFLPNCQFLLNFFFVFAGLSIWERAVSLASHLQYCLNSHLMFDAKVDLIVSAPNHCPLFCTYFNICFVTTYMYLFQKRLKSEYPHPESFQMALLLLTDLLIELLSLLHFPVVFFFSVICCVCILTSCSSEIW